MRIRQIYTSKSLRHFEGRMKKKYQLQSYVSKESPAIFYGVFCSSVPVIHAHRSLGVVLWAGTDAQMLRDWVVDGKEFPRCQQVEGFLSKPNLRHVCRSQQLREDLELSGVSCVFRRVSPVLTELFSVRPLGSCVYSYGSEYNRNKYGGDVIDQLRDRFPDLTFLSRDVGEGCVPYEKMSHVYERCFLGLRLTKHDGLPNSVIEMGLMGRPSVFNGDLPGSISWENVDDVARIIDLHKVNVGQCGDVQLSTRMRDELCISDDWLKTETYGEL